MAPRQRTIASPINRARTGTFGFEQEIFRAEVAWAVAEVSERYVVDGAVGPIGPRAELVTVVSIAIVAVAVAMAISVVAVAFTVAIGVSGQFTIC